MFSTESKREQQFEGGGRDLEEKLAFIQVQDIP